MIAKSSPETRRKQYLGYTINMQKGSIKSLSDNFSVGGWKVTSRFIQVALGIFWLLDGLLQLQRQMFTSHFASLVIAPAAQFEPIFVAGPIHLFIHIFLLHPAIFNSFAALTQLTLGILILLRRTTKIGLIASMAWGLLVWVIGEGYGGIFSGHTSLLMGAPGAALLYIILAIAVLPRVGKKTARPPYWLAFVWAFFWIGGAIYQLLPGQNTVSSLSAMIASNGFSQPGWLASLDFHVGSIINGFGTPLALQSGMHMSANQMAMMQTEGASGYWFILLAALFQLGIGITVFLPRAYRLIGISLGIIFSLMFWVIGQSFGRIFTGLATDPNAAPLFIALAVAIVGCSTLGSDLAGFFKRLERTIT